MDAGWSGPRLVGEKQTNRRHRQNHPPDPPIAPGPGGMGWPDPGRYQLARSRRRPEGVTQQLSGLGDAQSGHQYRCHAATPRRAQRAAACQLRCRCGHQSTTSPAASNTTASRSLGPCALTAPVSCTLLARSSSVNRSGSTVGVTVTHFPGGGGPGSRCRVRGRSRYSRSRQRPWWGWRVPPVATARRSAPGRRRRWWRGCS